MSSEAADDAASFSPRADSASANGDDHSSEDLEMDAYGDSFDAQWMAGASERKLKERAESIALKHLLTRHTSRSPMHWREVLSNHVLGGRVTVEEFKDAWSNVLDELPGDALSALCVRFGPMYMELYRGIVNVLNTQHNERNANFEIKQLWEQFTARKLCALCTPECELDLDEMRSFLTRKETEVDVVEVQLCRAAALLEDLAPEPLYTAKMLCGLLRQIGLPSVGPEMFSCITKIALKCSLEREPDHCTIGCLLRYCFARKNSLAEQIQGKTDDLSTQRMVQNLLQPSAAQQHVLAFLSARGEGRATLKDVTAALAQGFGDSLTIDFCEVLCRMWCRELYVNVSFIYSEDVELFCCPTGYALNIKTPLGAFRLQGRLRPVDSVRQLYKALANKLFVRLRATRVADSHLRIPSDVKVYSDPDRCGFIPVSNDILARSVSHESTLWVFSEYVDGLLDECAENEFEKAFLSRRAAGRNDDKAGVDEQKEGGEKREKKKRFLTPKDFLDELLSVGKPVIMPPPPAFFADETQAHKWNIPTVASYLCDELELPQYKAAFARHEINGHALICLDEETVTAKFNTNDAMHVTKIAAHSALLREKVLEASSRVLPLYLSDWDYSHVAGWLKYKQSCPSVALSALQKKVDGSMLLDTHVPAAEGGAESTDLLPHYRALEGLLWGGGPPPNEMAAACSMLAEAVRAEHKRLALKEQRASPRPPAPPAGGAGPSAMARRRRRNSSSEQQQLEDIEEGQGDEGEEQDEDVKVPVVVVDDNANPLVVPKKEKRKKKAAATAAEGVEGSGKEDSGKESREFQKQIAELQKLIEAQARSYETLSATADELRRQKEQSDHDLREREAEHRAQQELVEDLSRERVRAEQERQRTLKEKAAVANTLAVASNKFFKELDQERTRREKEIEDNRLVLEQRRRDEEEAAARAAKLGAAGLVRPELRGAPGVAGAVSFAAGEGSKGLVRRIRLQGLGAAALGDALPLWEGFLEQYRYRDDEVATGSGGDTRSLQQRLYSLWLQLGSRIYEDLLLARREASPPADLEMLTALETCCKRIIMAQVPKEQAAAAAADRYVMSVCFVFVLGCVKKTIARSGGKAEVARVASALSNLREGSLSHEELSRENLKLIFSDTLGVPFPSFYTFDALCQRVDVGRRGIVSFYPDVIGSFSQLTPLYDELVRPGPTLAAGGVRRAQAVVLTLLTLASEHIVSYVFAMKKGASLEDVFLDLVTSRLDSVPSFRTYALERKSDRAPEGSRDAEVVHLMQLVADVLFEMARPYLAAVPTPSARQTAAAPLLPRIGSASSAGRGGDGDTAALEWLQVHARDVCAAVARSLQLYGTGSSSDCMESLAAFFLTFISFRRSSLLAYCSKLLPEEMRPYTRMHRSEAQATAAAIEALVTHFAGEEEAREIARNTEVSQRLQLFEAAVAGAIGFFLPEQRRLPLVCAQCDAEHFLSQAVALRKKGPPSSSSQSGKSGSVMQQLVRRLKEGGGEKKAYAGMLSDVRGSLELGLFRPASTPEASSPLRGIAKGGKEKTSPGKREKQLAKRVAEQAQSQTITEVNVVLHNQRVAALSAYLEYLNSRAHSKKGILEVLLSLYRAATALCKGEVHDVMTADGSAVTLSRVELVKKAAEMQGAILEDMQRVPSVATQQLAKRVERLRRMLEQKKVVDADRGIALYLEQIHTMEQVLLQSNTDAISITSKIVTKLR